MTSPTQSEAYARLIAVLDAAGAKYRFIDHAPEGRTELVSAMRGHPVEQAAKCVILIAKLGKKVTRYVLAIVPGDARVDFGAVKQELGATFVGFADMVTAERLAGSVSGTILPFAFDPALTLIVDPSVLELREIFFNAGRLDRSLALDTADYSRLANPQVTKIALR